MERSGNSKAKEVSTNKEKDQQDYFLGGGVGWVVGGGVHFFPFNYKSTLTNIKIYESAVHILVKDTMFLKNK